uniref:Uncharacterized protein n=1 Tax=Arundo donax TaxID=35708 RepID=A0A0A9VQV4_ARUDO
MAFSNFADSFLISAISSCICFNDSTAASSLALTLPPDSSS